MTLDQVNQALVQAIISSPDPEKAARIATNIFYLRAAGETMESIAASYGLDWEEVKSND